MSTPEMIIDTNLFKINFTIIIAVVTFCFSVVITFIKLFPRKEIKDNEKPGNTPTCLQNHNDISENHKTIIDLQKDINECKTQIATIKIKIDNCIETTSELKKDEKFLAYKLDEFLKEILEMLH